MTGFAEPAADYGVAQAKFPFAGTDDDLPEAKPFLRWAGGKTRLLSAILPFTPDKIRNYHEPFLGSGAMFFALRRRAKACFLADLNTELINLWRVVQAEPKSLYEQLQGGLFHGRSKANESRHRCRDRR